MSWITTRSGCVEGRIIYFDDDTSNSPAWLGLPKTRERTEICLEYDGIKDGLVLSPAGAEIVEAAVIALPIWKSFSRFWGYENHPSDAPLWNVRFYRAGDQVVQLSCSDEYPLREVQRMLNDSRCWEREGLHSSASVS